MPYSYTGKGLHKYYNQLRPILTSGRGKFYVSIVIPVIKDQTRFEVYDIINEPVYDPDTKLSAKMITEVDVIAISRNHATYVLMDSEERVLCILNPFCEIHSPVYNILNAETCVTALYLKDADKINRFCKTQIVQPETIPHAHLLFDNQWLITTTTNLAYENCNGDRTSQTLPPGQTLLVIEENCEVTSRFFCIQQRKLGQEQLRTKLKFEESYDMISSLPHVWNLTKQNLGKMDEIPPSAPMGEIPFQALKNYVHQAIPLDMTVHRHTNTGLILILILLNVLRPLFCALTLG